MKAAHAFAILVRYAEAGVPEAERVHLYEAIAAVAKKADLGAEAELAKTVCQQLRAADRAQMKFHDVLQASSDADRH
jgi:hypothetical protein